MLKSTCVKEKEKERTFPRIMIARSNGAMVLFHENREGMVIYSPPGCNSFLGKYLKSWDMNMFDEIDEITITISQSKMIDQSKVN